MFKPAVSSGKRAPLAALLVACALLGSGCARADSRLPPPIRIMKELQHPNGLVVGQPEGFEATQSANGFVFTGSGNPELRHPVIATVSLVKGDAPAEPATPPLRTKTVGARDVRYRVVKSEGGSGGETYTLVVFEPAPAGHIRYEQSAQSELGEPDFALAWTLVANTRYQESRNN
jgi:hypothetical protein